MVNRPWFALQLLILTLAQGTAAQRRVGYGWRPHYVI